MPRFTPETAFRTPDPFHRIRLRHPDLPEALEGVSILHLTDPHVRRNRPRFQRLANALARTKADLAVITGDWMSYAGDEPQARTVLLEVAEALRTRFGVFGVFGNHDTQIFRTKYAPDPRVCWLDDGLHHLPDLPLSLLALNWPEDWPRAAEACRARRQKGRLTIGLVHHPGVAPGAMRLGAEIVLAGHTHGGQLRLPGRWAAYTSSEMPRRQAAGLFRIGDAQLCICRGMGDAGLDFRLFCPPQITRYELARGPLPRARDDRTGLVEAW